MEIEPHPDHRDANEADVSHFEMSIAARLPDDYRDFLLRYNGGYPRPSKFRGGDEVLSHFFGLWQKHADLNYELLAHRGFIPEGTIPIASDPFGNSILLEVARPNLGRIWFWDHERSGEPAKAVSLLANSFTEFVESLVPVDGDTAVG
jgi:hypothetical protein